MSGPVIQNFRGARALIVHPDDANRETLATTLRRLGLLVALIEPDIETKSPGIEACDIVFFDADQGLGGVFGDTPPPDAAYVAMIGVEAPGRLARVVRQRCCAHLMKPVRSSGVFTALFIGVNEFARRRRDVQAREALERRLAGRRLVTKVVLQMIAAEGIDEEEAYRRLRRESMRRRVSIEALACERLGEEEAGKPDIGILSA